MPKSPRTHKPTYERFVRGPIERFDEAKTVYSMADRGEVRGFQGAVDRGLVKAARRQPGFLREDFALCLAGRTIDTLVRDTLFCRSDQKRRWSIPPEPMAFASTDDASALIKRAGIWFGASEVGIASLQRHWLYSHWGEHYAQHLDGVEPGDPLELEPQYTHAIVLAVEMSYADIQRSPAVIPTTDLGYSQMAYAAAMLAEYIRMLGYDAIPSGNDMALSIPLAVDAGLGEMGRNGLLITPRFGPRVRLSKVFTSLPLEPDPPVDLGVQAFCETCKKCAANCPGNAIPEGERTESPRTPSSNGGIFKWQLEPRRCFDWWYRNGTVGCANCIRSCPWNKPAGLVHDLTRRVVARTPMANPLFAKLDDTLGYGRQVIRSTPTLSMKGPTWAGDADPD
jgi:epoxyqueuosine reductase